MNSTTTGATTTIRLRPRWMLIDDDVQVLKLIRLSLARLGQAEIHCCQTSTEAWELFVGAPQTFQLVITDLNIAPFNSLVLGARMRALFPNLKIILVTGDVNAISQAQASERGFAATLYKPFSVPALRATVMGVLGASPSDGTFFFPNPPREPRICWT